MKKLLLISTLTFFVLLSSFSQTNDDIRWHRSMAGQGNPWTPLKGYGYAILEALHAHQSIKETANSLNITKQQVLDKINVLVESSLVKKTGETYKTDVFIADYEEVNLSFELAEEIGLKMAKVVIDDWPELEKAFAKLGISNSYNLKEQGFMLIGSRILDMGVLGELVLDKSLLLPPPSRPGPKRPDAQYYFWYIKGSFKHAGKYGQDDSDLNEANWHMLNFGLNGYENHQRRKFNKQISSLLKTDTANCPHLFATTLGVPFLNKKDSDIWQKTAKSMSQKLLNVMLKEGQNITDFHQSLASAKSSKTSFSDFFCWFFHVVYQCAIDKLHETGHLQIPELGYSGMVIYREGDEGLLINN